MVKTGKYAAAGKVEPVIYPGGSGEKLIALTFDDGPHVKHTEELLDVLAKNNTKATFFVIGKMMRKQPGLVRKIRDAGQELANHSFSHVTLSKLTYEQQLTDILACSLIMRDVSGVTPTWCRAPGGRQSLKTLDAIGAMGMKVAMWTSDPLDYAFPGIGPLYNKMIQDLRPGAIYLLHSGAPDTPKVLSNFIKYARNLGYRFVTMTELYAHRAGAQHTSNSRSSRHR